MPTVFRPANLPTRDANRKQYDVKRAATYAWRGWYKTKRWYAQRARQLRDHPVCVMCEADGFDVAATVCDHVERHGGDEVKFWSGPFQSLCATHHNRDKQRAEQAASS
jgi:hypothetical protein